ncbi:MAG: hypothetical protein QT05_C0003G0031 [archaeon GW2011_AR13]|nr:MAG: hypothetical protein QT05_C0003G0031 [archaeon GW2011_AR13]HIG94204.1 hypothetical protein [Nanoarchaeota archaeon]HIH62686.1 hypothetical protein [Nanoarchaeota archaeon]HIJ09893.1 hypothetical protein [Nanoarchaeota archaeon]
MKKSVLIYLLIMFFSFTFVSSEACKLDISLINQDPYPAIPGDYVKVVFQVNGVSNPECGKVEFELLDKYPISFDPTDEPKIIFQSGIYNKDYSSFLTAPYKVRVDANALNGDNPIEVQYKKGSNLVYETQQFMLNVQDPRVDFEVHVKDYDYTTNTITFEILNIGKNDVEAITIEVPKQNNIIVKGSNRNIIGDLDSNEYTTAEFEATPINGIIKINIIYTDNINVRRIVESEVLFDSSYFQGRKADEKTNSYNIYYLIGAVILILIFFAYRNRKKKRDLHKHK